MIHIRSQVKTWQSQSNKLKNCQKSLNSNFAILKETLHVTHPLKLLDNMYKYETDPTRTVGATEPTQDAGRTDVQMDGRTYRRMDGVKPIYPPTTSLCGGGGIIMVCTAAPHVTILNKISFSVGILLAFKSKYTSVYHLHIGRNELVEIIPMP